MAKGRNYTKFQQGIIKRYYDHKDDIASQKLGDIVSEIYLATDDRKAGRLWAKAEKALTDLGANKVRVEKVVAERDLEGLAQLVTELG